MYLIYCSLFHNADIGLIFDSFHNTNIPFCDIILHFYCWGNNFRSALFYELYTWYRALYVTFDLAVFVMYIKCMLCFVYDVEIWNKLHRRWKLFKNKLVYWIVVSNLFFSPNQIAVFFWKFEFLFHDSQYTGIWNYYFVYQILRCLSKNRLYTKMLTIHLFSTFTIKTPQALYRENTDTGNLTISCNTNNLAS